MLDIHFTCRLQQMVDDMTMRAVLQRKHLINIIQYTHYIDGRDLALPFNVFRMHGL